MSFGRCPLRCGNHHNFTRRDFLRGSTALLAGSSLLSGCSSLRSQKIVTEPIRPCGPASTYVPTIKAAFVRRKEDYGMLWPGAVYDGKAAREMYSEKMASTAGKLGAKLELRAEPIYSLAEAEGWVAEAEAQNVDGLVLVMLDRQKHSWPTARKVAQSDIASIIYSPLGTSFTTNTINLAETPGCVIYSTNDFGQAAYGMKMLCAAAKMRRTRCVVIRGRNRSEGTLGDTGIATRVVPATTFIEQYDKTADSKEILAMAEDYIRRARRVTGATPQDVVNGVKSYYVAGKILENEQADAITMDCLGALGRIKVSLPCIAWSRMNDDGIPAACEADYGAVASHILTQYLFDRPGFQQDPVADTADDSIIGAALFVSDKAQRFSLGARTIRPDAPSRQPGCRAAHALAQGQRVTSIDLLPGKADGTSPSKVLISAGTVLENMDVPPSGGCVVSVKVRFDGGQEVLSFPGFHQIFFYGDYKHQMKDFCQLCKFDAQVV